VVLNNENKYSQTYTVGLRYVAESHEVIIITVSISMLVVFMALFFIYR